MVSGPAVAVIRVLVLFWTACLVIAALATTIAAEHERKKEERAQPQEVGLVMVLNEDTMNPEPGSSGEMYPDGHGLGMSSGNSTADEEYDDQDDEDYAANMEAFLDAIVNRTAQLLFQMIQTNAGGVMGGGDVKPADGTNKVRRRRGTWSWHHDLNYSSTWFSIIIPATARDAVVSLFSRSFYAFTFTLICRQTFHPPFLLFFLSARLRISYGWECTETIHRRCRNSYQLWIFI